MVGGLRCRICPGRCRIGRRVRVGVIDDQGNNEKKGGGVGVMKSYHVWNGVLKVEMIS
jgi:hypothetical protein